MSNTLILGFFISILFFVSCSKEGGDIKEKISEPPISEVIFISTRDGNHQIYSMNIDGSNQVRISKSYESKYYWPRVSPDNKSIVYTNGNAELYLCNIDGNNSKLISESGEKCSTPSWSPDGKKIIYSSSRDTIRNEQGNSIEHIWVYNLDDSISTRLTYTDLSDKYPSFSPDGNKIVFTSLRDKIYFTFNSENWSIYVRQIYIMNSDGSSQKRLTALHQGIVYGNPSFSPDGEKILYTMENARGGENSKWRHICVMNADGSHPMRISNITDNHEYPSWSKDGKEIVFNAEINGINIIMIMNNDGSNIRILTDTTNDNFTPSFYN